MDQTEPDFIDGMDYANLLSAIEDGAVPISVVTSALDQIARDGHSQAVMVVLSQYREWRANA